MDKEVIKNITEELNKVGDKDSILLLITKPTGDNRVQLYSKLGLANEAFLLLNLVNALEHTCLDIIERHSGEFSARDIEKARKSIENIYDIFLTRDIEDFFEGSEAFNSEKKKPEIDLGKIPQADLSKTPVASPETLAFLKSLKKGSKGDHE